LRVRPGRASNAELGQVLDRIAELLHAQDANPFRVQAWRTAADALRSQDRPVRALFDEGGMQALDAIPGIGRGIASALRELIRTGRLGLLDRLEGQVSPEDLFITVPGIGERLAQQIHRQLGIDTLEDLERAARDGRLEKLPGFGPRRVAAVRNALAAWFGLPRRAPRKKTVAPSTAAPADNRPDVALLLDVDAEYQRKANRGELRKIAPRRFNPTGEAWLPILHTERDNWHFTALYSNTSTAHELGKTRDWVVLYFDRDGANGQSTVVTEHRGELNGRRVVRGREAECLTHYTQTSRTASATGA
jgi:hypothetical protein